MNYNEIIYNSIKDYEDISKCNFYELAKPFEYYSAIILSNEYNRKIYHYDELDMIYKEENNLSKKDTGIDLCDKQDIIVQVKLRSNPLNWKEISTFVAQINQYDHTTKKRFIKWQEPILIRNSCSKVSPNLQEQLNFNICVDKPLHLEDFYNYCNNLKANPPIIENNDSIIEARDYQITAINLIKDNPNKNIYLCLPTGSGKTYVFIMSIELNKKYVILVPFIILLEQWYEEIIKIRPEFKKHIQRIGDGNNTFNNDKLITITTYNSVELVGNLQDYDRVVTDEAHRIVKPEIYEEEIEEDDTKYTTIINNNINDNNNNILLSATLDNPDNDNDLYYKVEIRDLINNGILTDYQIKIPIFEDNANDISVCQYIVKNYTNMIIYSSGHKEGMKITETLNNISKNCAYYIDCNTPKQQRKDIIKDFKKGNIKFLVNVRILIEGFNAKICNGVILYHISKNDKTIIQIVGRALRKYKNKLYAYIVLPFINTDDSKDLEFILRVLANNDPEIKHRCINKKLGGYIDIEINKEYKEDDDDDETLMETKIELVFDSLGKCIKGNIELWRFRLEKVKKFIDDNKKRPNTHSKNSKEKKLSKWISTQNINYKNNKYIMENEEIRKEWEEFKEKYAEYILYGEELWRFKLKKVKKFIDDNEKTPSVSSKNPEEKTLSRWIHQATQNYKNNKYIMENEEIRKEWDEFKEKYAEYILYGEELWRFKLKKVKRFIFINKNKPSCSSTNLEEKKLGIWISTQKTNYKNNTNIMSNEEIKKEWEEFKEEYGEYLLSKEKLWRFTLEKVKKFINENKKRPIQDSNSEERTLALWLSSQKTNYTKKKQIMQYQEIRKEWEEFKEEYGEYIFTAGKELWRFTLEKVKKFINDNENKEKPNKNSTNTEEIKLAYWLDTQNKTYITNVEIMSNQEIRKEWEEFKKEYEIFNNKELWRFKLKKVKEFIFINKNKPSCSSTNPEEKELYKWLSHQNTTYKNNTKIMQYQEIRKEWEEFKEEYGEYILTLEEKWRFKLKKVKEFIFVKKQKPKQKPRQSENSEENKLASWICLQNKNYKNKEAIMKTENKEIRKEWKDFKEKYL